MGGVVCGFIAMAAAVELHRSTRRRRSVWELKPWIISRPVSGAYSNLFNDLLNIDEASFRNFIRMDLPAFEDLYFRVEYRLTKVRTHFRQPISAREKLCVTIW